MCKSVRIIGRYLVVRWLIEIRDGIGPESRGSIGNQTGVRMMGNYWELTQHHCCLHTTRIYLHDTYL